MLGHLLLLLIRRLLELRHRTTGRIQKIQRVSIIEQCSLCDLLLLVLLIALLITEHVVGIKVGRLQRVVHQHVVLLRLHRTIKKVEKIIVIR